MQKGYPLTSKLKFNFKPRDLHFEDNCEVFSRVCAVSMIESPQWRSIGDALGIPYVVLEAIASDKSLGCSAPSSHFVAMFKTWSRTLPRDKITLDAFATALEDCDKRELATRVRTLIYYLN